VRAATASIWARVRPFTTLKLAISRYERYSSPWSSSWSRFSRGTADRAVVGPAAPTVETNAERRRARASVSGHGSPSSGAGRGGSSAPTPRGIDGDHASDNPDNLCERQPIDAFGFELVHDPIVDLVRRGGDELCRTTRRPSDLGAGLGVITPTSCGGDGNSLTPGPPRAGRADGTPLLTNHRRRPRRNGQPTRARPEERTRGHTFAP
jgi:hypothetical protein